MSLKTLQRNLVPRSLVDEVFSFENKRSVYDIKYNGEQNALLQVRGTDLLSTKPKRDRGTRLGFWYGSLRREISQRSLYMMII